MPNASVPLLIINKILLFGDDQIEQSHISGIGFNIAPALQREYWAKLQVITHGYHGYTSEMGRWMIDAILDAEIPDPGESKRRGTVELVIIAFGTNDAVVKQHAQQHVPVDRYIENVKFMVSRIRERGKVKVILIGPALVNEIAPDVSMHRSTLRAKEYGEALEKIAKETRVPVLNLWREFAASTGWKQGDPIPCKRPTKGRRSSSLDPDRAAVARGVMKGARYQRNLSRDEHFASLLADDGIHLSRSGYQYWYQALIKMIRSNWPELDAKNMRPVFPPVGEVDTSDLPRSLYKNTGQGG